MITTIEVAELLTAPKTLARDMIWDRKRGKLDLGWLEARMPVEVIGDAEIQEQFFVSCQWRKKQKDIPQQWTFNLIYKGNRIYALHAQPDTSHANNKGLGKPFYKKDIEGLHEHIWVDEGDGYAEPINLPLGQPEVMWRMFLSRAGITPADFFHPDGNEPELDI